MHNNIHNPHNNFIIAESQADLRNMLRENASIELRFGPRFKCDWCGEMQEPSSNLDKAIGYAINGYRGRYCSRQCLSEAQNAGTENKQPDQNLINKTMNELAEAHRKQEIKQEKRKQKEELERKYALIIQSIGCVFLTIAILMTGSDGYRLWTLYAAFLYGLTAYRSRISSRGRTIIGFFVFLLWVGFAAYSYKVFI